MISRRALFLGAGAAVLAHGSVTASPSTGAGGNGAQSRSSIAAKDATAEIVMVCGSGNLSGGWDMPCRSGPTKRQIRNVGVVI